MVTKQLYTSLNETLAGVRIQVIDSLDFCVNEMPSFKTPESMFKALKLLTTYRNDPPGIELLQSVPTLLDDNYWGVPGAGDCDCFTILTLSMCIANGWNDNEIMLVGRDKKKAVHIYSTTKINGVKYVLDLTNSFINVERKYKFYQSIKV